MRFANGGDIDTSTRIVVKIAAIRNQEPRPMLTKLIPASPHEFQTKKRPRRFNIRLGRSSLRGQPSEFV